jgi:glycosyltransferase involved in cell wall biosynthesis
MRIGLIISQPFGESIGTDVRIRGLSQGLAKLGAEVIILSPFNTKEEELFNNVILKPLKEKSDSLIPLKTIYNIGRKIINSRRLRYLPIPQIYYMERVAKSLAKDIEKQVKTLNLDVVQAEQELAALSCVFAVNELSVPILFDIHGIWSEELVASGLLKPNSSKYKKILKIEKRIVNNVDAVLVVSEEMKKYVVGKYEASSDFVHIISNAAFPRRNERPYEPETSKVIYAGTLTFRENMPLLLHSFLFAAKKCPKARFYLSGKGDALNFVKSYARQIGIDPTFTWFEDFHRFYDFLMACHVGTIPALKHSWRQMATPAKLYDYLSAGVPVVSVDIGSSWNEIIRENKVGILTEDDPEAFANAIITFLKNPELVYEYGNRAIQLVKQKLNYQKSAEQLKKLYMKLL